MKIEKKFFTLAVLYRDNDTPMVKAKKQKYIFKKLTTKLKLTGEYM